MFSWTRNFLVETNLSTRWTRSLSLIVVRGGDIKHTRHARTPRKQRLGQQETFSVCFDWHFRSKRHVKILSDANMLVFTYCITRTIKSSNSVGEVQILPQYIYNLAGDMSNDTNYIGLRFEARHQAIGSISSGLFSRPCHVILIHDLPLYMSIAKSRLYFWQLAQNHYQVESWNFLWPDREMLLVVTPHKMSIKLSHHHERREIRDLDAELWRNGYTKQLIHTKVGPVELLDEWRTSRPELTVTGWSCS